MGIFSGHIQDECDILINSGEEYHFNSMSHISRELKEYEQIKNIEGD